MPKRLSKKRERDDGTQSAFRALQHVIAQSEGEKSKAPVIAIASRRRKNPAAVALGRKGGMKSAAARMEKIPEAERRRIASAAARARWAKEKGDG
jgi:hypothetical protein